MNCIEQKLENKLFKKNGLLKLVSWHKVPFGTYCYIPYLTRSSSNTVSIKIFSNAGCDISYRGIYLY